MILKCFLFSKYPTGVRGCETPGPTLDKRAIP